MNNKKIIISVGLVFVLLQALFISFVIIREPKTVSLQCGSSFIRNINGEPDINYAGEMTLILTKNGKGTLTIDGKTNETEPRTFHRAYFFDYHLDEDGILRDKVTSTTSGVSNELPEKLFRKQFIGLEYQIRGGLRIHKFRNVYVLSTPGFILNTCAPV